MLKNIKLRDDKGTVLLLFPAAVIVVIVMAAIVLDLGYALVRTHQLQYVAQAAANDAVSVLNEDDLRDSGDLGIDALNTSQISAVARAAVAASDTPDARVYGTSSSGSNPGTRFDLAVELIDSIDLFIAPALGSPSSYRHVTGIGRSVAFS